MGNRIEKYLNEEKWGMNRKIFREAINIILKYTSSNVREELSSNWNGKYTDKDVMKVIDVIYKEISKL